jgi:hypothetical protein
MVGTLGAPAVSTYPTAGRRPRARKLSVSLPPDLVAFLESRAREHGTALSTELAEVVARERAADEQRRLDEALALDAEDDRSFARGVAVAAREAFKDVEW